MTRAKVRPTFSSFVEEAEFGRRPWLFVRKGRSGFDPDQPRDEIGRWTAEGVSPYLGERMPRKNLDNIQLGPDGDLRGAKSMAGRPIEGYMYNPRTGTLLAGNDFHADLHVKYAPKERYDDFVKIAVPVAAGGVPYLYLDRHSAADDADAWNKACEALEALVKAGLPRDTKMEFRTRGRGPKAAIVGVS